MGCMVKIVSYLTLVLLVITAFASAVLGQSSRAHHQDRDAIAALPTSAELEARNQTRTRSFYRQSADSQTRSQGQTNSQQQTYPYPASRNPSAASYTARNSGGAETNARFDSRLTAGSVTTTGNLRQRVAGTGADANTRTSQSNISFAQSSTTGNGSANPNSVAATNSRPPGDRYASTQPTWGQTNVFRQSAYQAPNYRTAQNCACAPGYAPVAGYPPQGFVPPASQTPALNPGVGTNPNAPPVNLQFPQQPGYGQPVYAQPGYGQLPPGYGYGSGIGTPQFGAQGARWWTPFFSGSGVYTPLIKLVPTKVGTYLGQGIIGQPTAYVDGEPLRNLLRYLGP